LSILGLGCWSFGGGEYWGGQSQRDTDEAVRAAVGLGLNYFDTAEAYNYGRSEAALGQALRGVPRDSVRIGSKVSPTNLRPADLAAHCEASLRRLGTDYIDLYMIHWPVHPASLLHAGADPATGTELPRIDSAAETLMELRAQGKILHIGVSNFGLRPLEEFLALSNGVAANQLPYNLLCRAIEQELMPFCRRRGVGIIGYMTLMQGILADSHASIGEMPAVRRRTRHFSAAGNPQARHGGPGAEKETGAALGELRRIARETGLPVRVLAQKWAIRRQEIACTLVGERNAKQLAENVEGVLSSPLSDDIVDALDRATDRLKAELGPSIDYYESAENDRTA
jgi:aryl-alcohol dehydrogenase-like predicted oxidoreductase